MERKRVNNGDAFFAIDGTGNIYQIKHTNSNNSDLLFGIGNYFNTEEDAKKMAEKLRAVLNGADIIEDWEREKINSWDVMLETKDEISKNYSNLLNNPKVKAVTNGADAIEWPSEEEISEKVTELGSKFAKDVEVESYFACCAEMMASWLKTKIVK